MHTYQAIRKGKGNTYKVNKYSKKKFYKQILDEMVTIEEKMNAVAMVDKEDSSDVAEKLEDFNDHF